MHNSACISGVVTFKNSRWVQQCTPTATSQHVLICLWRHKTRIGPSYSGPVCTCGDSHNTWRPELSRTLRGQRKTRRQRWNEFPHRKEGNLPQKDSHACSTGPVMRPQCRASGGGRIPLQQHSLTGVTHTHRLRR